MFRWRVIVSGTIHDISQALFGHSQSRGLLHALKENAP